MRASAQLCTTALVHTRVSLRFDNRLLTHTQIHSDTKRTTVKTVTTCLELPMSGRYVNTEVWSNS